MGLTRFAIGSILFIEAYLLMYSVEENYRVVKGYFSDCECMKKVGFQCVEDLRLFLVAFIATGAFSLTFGCSVFAGFLAQLVWTVTQSQLYYSCGMKETLNTLIQVVFILVLLSETCKDCAESSKYCKQKNCHSKPCGSSQQSCKSEKPASQKEMQSSSHLIKEQASVSGQLKESKSEDSGASKNKKKKNK